MTEKLDSPTFASTPKTILRGRKSYRDHVTEVSHILQENERVELHSEEEESYDSEIEEKSLPKEQSHGSTTYESTLNDTINKSTMSYILIALTVAFGTLLAVSYSSNMLGRTCGLERLKIQFPLDRNFWDTVESSIREIVEYDKPSVVLVLYNGNKKTEIDTFLQEFANYSKCTLDKSGPNLIIEGKHLNSALNKESYGHIITHYEPRLRESGVMIVKNLDEVDGYIAQGFHSICDEYTPLVKNALIIFTIRYDGASDKDVSVAEKILRRNWSNLEDDILDPLLTRVIGMVIKFQ